MQEYCVLHIPTGNLLYCHLSLPIRNRYSPITPGYSISPKEDDVKSWLLHIGADYTYDSMSHMYRERKLQNIEEEINITIRTCGVPLASWYIATRAEFEIIPFQEIFVPSQYRWREFNRDGSLKTKLERARYL